MEIIRHSCTLKLCRLCGRCDHHKIDILEHDLHIERNAAITLCEKIFRCVGVQVRRDDASTKICENCLIKINDIIRFRELCAATDIQLRFFSESVDEESNKIYQSAIDTLSEWSAIAAGMRIPNGECVTIRKRKHNEMGTCDLEANTAKITRRDFISSTHSLEVDEGAAITNPNAIECTKTTNDECPEVKLSTTVCYVEPQHESTEGCEGKENERTANSISDIPELDTMNAQQQSETRFEAIYATFNTTVLRKTSNETVKTPENGGINVNAEKSKKQKSGFPTKTKNKANSKATDNVGNFHVKCRSKCSERFESIDAMMCHVMQFHGKGVKKSFTCYLCKKSFGTKHHVQMHMNSIHTGRRCQCPIANCSKSFAEKVNLDQHINAAHTRKIAFECTRCPEKFYRKVNLTRHLASKHGEGISYSCHSCKKPFAANCDLQRHMDSVHMGRRFHCPITKCSMSFSQEPNLNSHINTAHTRKIAFECTRCPEKFYRKVNLTRHLASKHGEGISYICNSCNKPFTANSDLQRHINTIHMGRRYQCPIAKCSKSFTQKVNLVQHTNAVHSRKIAFKCTKCPKKFYYKNSLKYHLENKHGEGISSCKKPFAAKLNLERHMISKHTGTQDINGPEKCYIWTKTCLT